MDQLIAETVRRGFNNVIDAFHVVNHSEIPNRFFVDRRTDTTPGIELTDDFLRLKETLQYENLPSEVEARWRLIGTASELRLPSRKLLGYSPATDMLVVPGRILRRNDIIGSRDALNGYEKGRCFCCFAGISIASRSPDVADVDHFVPRILIADRAEQTSIECGISSWRAGRATAGLMASRPAYPG